MVQDSSTADVSSSGRLTAPYRLLVETLDISQEHLKACCQILVYSLVEFHFGRVWAECDKDVHDVRRSSSRQAMYMRFEYLNVR